MTRLNQQDFPSNTYGWKNSGKDDDDELGGNAAPDTRDNELTDIKIGDSRFCIATDDENNAAMDCVELERFPY